MVLVAAHIALPLAAQTIRGKPIADLTVRPREMATGTRTDQAGVHELTPPAIQWEAGEENPSPTRVYVPERCVGTRRCPLLVSVWPSWQETMLYVKPMVDKYGFILLNSDNTSYAYIGYTGSKPASMATAAKEVQHLDAVLKQVLQRFAIDPDKIAIMGICATGQAPMNIGIRNPQVFNRIVGLAGPLLDPPQSSSSPTVDELGLPNPKVEFFFNGGIDEASGPSVMRQVEVMRKKGHRVTDTFGFLYHGHQIESYDHVGRWLQQTWAIPNPANRPAPLVLADPLPELTLDVLAKMTAFWTRFVQEPDSIRIGARRAQQAYLRDVIVPIGEERPIVPMTDMTALAAQYPSVAADLKAAGLTAQDHDVYRVALASARRLLRGGPMSMSVPKKTVAETLDPASMQAKNLAFMRAHPDEFLALENASNMYAPNDVMHFYSNIWTMP